MTKIDNKDIENIEYLKKALKSNNLGTIKIKKGEYEIEVSLRTESSLNSNNKPRFVVHSRFVAHKHSHSKIFIFLTSNYSTN